MFILSTTEMTISADNIQSNKWNIIVIDTNASFDYSSIALDSNGNPHIVYTSNLEPEYVYWDGTQWNYEKMAGGMGYPTSIAMDENDVPHISMTVPTVNMSYDSYYGNRSGGNWQFERVDSGFGGSIVVKNGTVHIAYNSVNGLTYVKLFMGLFQKYILDDNNASWECIIGGDRAITIDERGMPHIGYIKWRDSPRKIIVKYINYNGTVWNTCIIANTTLAAGTVAIRLNHSEVPSIGYSFDGNVKYASIKGNVFINETIESHSGSACVAIDDRNQVYVSYKNGSDINHYQLKQAKRNGTKWDMELIYTAGNSSEQFERTSIAVDRTGYSHIVFSPGKLCYATNKPIVPELTVIILPVITLIALFIGVCPEKRTQRTETMPNPHRRIPKGGGAE